MKNKILLGFIACLTLFGTGCSKEELDQTKAPKKAASSHDDPCDHIYAVDFEMLNVFIGQEGGELTYEMSIDFNLSWSQNDPFALFMEYGDWLENPPPFGQEACCYWLVWRWEFSNTWNVGSPLNYNSSTGTYTWNPGMNQAYFGPRVEDERPPIVVGIMKGKCSEGQPYPNGSVIWPTRIINWN